MDLMKTVLVLGMIFAHTIQFLGNKGTGIGFIISQYINLITFSGFMFCFAYVCNIAYISKNKEVVKSKIMRNIIELLIIFYISGIAFEAFVSKDLSVLKIVKILLLQSIPGYSEFLISFCGLNVVLFVFFNQIKKIISNRKLLIITTVSTLLLTFIPYKLIFFNPIGIFIGSNKFACFPIVQYICYFLIGAYFQKNKIIYSTKVFILFLISSLSMFLYIIVNNRIPNRFPPSMFWIIGGSIFIYCYYIISSFIVKRINIANKIYFIGENTLYFLLLSNLILFVMKYSDIRLSNLICFIVSIIITVICYFIIYIYHNRKESRLENNYTNKENILSE